MTPQAVSASAAAPGRAGAPRGRALAGAAALCLVVGMFTGLGAWQVQRHGWKAEVLAAIDAAESAPPQPLSDDPPLLSVVRLDGRLRHDQGFLYGAEARDGAAGPVIGAELVQPLEREGHPTVLIDLGWVPDRTPATLAAELPARAFVRKPDAGGLFGAAPAAGRHVRRLDPASIAAMLGPSSPAPHVLVALGPATEGLQPAPAIPRPPDDHLGYAATWFGLALATLAWWGARRRVQATG